MPYVRDEEAMFDTGDEEFFEGLYDDEEKWEEEWATEAAPRYRRGAVSLPLPARRPFRPVAGASGASIQTPAGRAQVQFPKPVATQEAVNNLARELKAEIAALSAAIKKVNQTLDSNTAIVDKKVNTVMANWKKSQESNQMMAILPLLLTKPPTLTTLTLQAPAETGKTPPDPVKYTVTTQEVKKDNTSLLLLPMMMMGGGMGGGGDSSNMMSMMFMVLALSGGLG
jgi:hypothetical protein